MTRSAGFRYFALGGPAMSSEKRVHPTDPIEEEWWTIYVCPECDRVTGGVDLPCVSDQHPGDRAIEVVPASLLTEARQEAEALRDESRDESCDADRWLDEAVVQRARADRVQADLQRAREGLREIDGLLAGPIHGKLQTIRGECSDQADLSVIDELAAGVADDVAEVRGIVSIALTISETTDE